MSSSKRAPSRSWKYPRELGRASAGSARQGSSMLAPLYFGRLGDRPKEEHDVQPRDYHPADEVWSAIRRPLPARRQGALRLGEAVRLALGARGRDRPAAAPASVGDQARPGPLGVPPRVAHRGDRGRPARSRIEHRNARVFQGITETSAYQAMTRACRNARCPTITRTTYGTGGSRSGTGRASPLGSLRSGPGTRGRR